MKIIGWIAERKAYDADKSEPCNFWIDVYGIEDLKLLIVARRSNLLCVVVEKSMLELEHH